MPDSLTSFRLEAYLTIYDNLEFLFRILLSAGAGALIGWERAKRLKDAGLRTHFIIAMTSAVFMMISKYAFLDIEGLAGSRGADSARIAAQVVGCISFLGAGVIIKGSRTNNIRGLTTAAGMWATGAAGLAIGAGMYWLGIIETASVVILQTLLHRFPVGNDTVCTQEITVRMADRKELFDLVHGLIQAHGGVVEESDISREENIITMRLLIRLQEPIAHKESLQLMTEHSDIYRISI